MGELRLKTKNPPGLEPSIPAARAKFALLLLPSGPDKVHGMTPHGAQTVIARVDKAHYSIPGPVWQGFFRRFTRTAIR